MVKLDLEINEITGLAELGKIDKKKLGKYLKKATKEELEVYIINNSLGDPEPEEPEEPEEKEKKDPEDDDDEAENEDDEDDI